MISVKEFVYLLLIYSVICFLFFFFGYSYFAFLSWRVGGKLQLITIEVKAGEDLFSKKRLMRSVQRTIWEVCQKHLMLFSKFIVLVDWEIIMCLIKLVDPFEARNNCHRVKTFLVCRGY